MLYEEHTPFFMFSLSCSLRCPFRVRKTFVILFTQTINLSYFKEVSLWKPILIYIVSPIPAKWPRMTQEPFYSFSPEVDLKSKAEA